MKERDNIYWVIVIGFLALALGTRFHDPILHGFVILINGWEFSGSTTGLTTGSTDAILYSSQIASTSTAAIWTFYMFPPLFIFALVIITTLIRTEKIIFILGIILMGLNLPSLDPTNRGSDAYKASNFLIERGWGEFYGYGLHYILFFVIIIIWLIYLDIVVENNSRDAKKRIRGII